MKKIISYIWPVTKKIKSNINGILEITWIDGKKVLDSKNANYSYGSLQRLLSYGISKINLQYDSEILLLGLGGGSVIQSLRKNFKHTGKITAVEIDEMIIEIAKQEFNIVEDESLTIICDDAIAYVETCQQKFDLIIIDLFIDTIVPDQFYKSDFWNNLILLTKPKGHVIFNAGINLKEKTNIEYLINHYQSKIKFTKHDEVEGSNIVLIGEFKN
ncbi:methyltransferase domain-containing protein [Aquimarina addita]|uniref:Methyltransferase domain-containing protein n=1 Tax=Aquimarina addita TaxID=870485 RepID=A0ABP6UM50_9FLAO